MHHSSTPACPEPFTAPGGDGARSRAARHPRYFLVTSQGLAGSRWLASSLNLHPEITCAMGIDHPLVSMTYYYNHDLIMAKTAAIRHQDEIRHGFYSRTLRQHFRRDFAARGAALDGTLERDHPVRDLQHMYDELEWFAPGLKYYGNVHVCVARHALEYLRASPARRDVLLVNLIRHPLTRTEAAITSVVSHVINDSDSDWHNGVRDTINTFVEKHADLRRAIEAQFHVDFEDLRQRAVLYCYYHHPYNHCWAGEITNLPEARHITLEGLMTDRDYFASLVWELTGREVVASPDFLDTVHTEEHLTSGRHLGHGRAPGPQAQYETWTDWERHEFRQTMHRLDLARVYAPFGYDFSFVG